MPALMMQSFNGAFGLTTGPAPVFHWMDDPTEDSEFASAMAYIHIVVNPFVDRSGTTPVLRWEHGAGNPSSKEIGPVGSYWFRYATGGGPGGSGRGPGVVDISGHWECDQYGRPYDLNDLLA